jgi:hypothetical protein
MNSSKHWIVTADLNRAALFSCRHTPGGALHVEHIRSLENTHRNQHEHHRPTQMGGAERRGSLGRSAAAAAPHTASLGHEIEEEQLRFARDVKPWLNQAAKDVGDGHLSVFAPPRFLGLLRSEMGAPGSAHDPADRMDLCEGELGHLRTHELAVHPAIVTAVTRPVRTVQR